ncbi:ATP-dependent sacrificial sulfur transferase LarE [[Eubacterium] cellulosolvens]
MIKKINKKLEEKILHIINSLKQRKSAVVALSGGVDSSVVAFIAKKALGDLVMAVTVESDFVPEEEIMDAKKIAKEIGIKHLVIKIDPLSNQKLISNPRNRCYYCKKELIDNFKQVAKDHGLKSIVDGTNIDDLKSHRPGLLALKEAKVYAPFVEEKITKEEIRLMADKFGLSLANKPSNTCLATRIPYGQEITVEKLQRIAEAEEFIKNLISTKHLRVRDHNSFARIEVEKKDIKYLLDARIADLIVKKLKEFGFEYVTIDLEGYRSGSMNRVAGD